MTTSTSSDAGSLPSLAPDGLVEATDRGVVQGLAVFRWAAWSWIALTAMLTRETMARPWLAAALLFAALAVTVTLTVILRRAPQRLLRATTVAAELTVGAALLLLDGLVRRPDTVFATGQSLASVWPITGIVAAGVVFGPAGGAGAGTLLGACRIASTVLNDVDAYDPSRVLSLANTTVTYALAGAAFGYVYRVLRGAREEVAAARAREEIARTLHDGVLQTLAVVERRATDPQLARLAREQERELRGYLFGDQQAPPGDLGAAFRTAAGRFEHLYGGRVEVLVPDDLDPLPPERCATLAGAVGELLNNAGKHGEARHVVVFVDADDDGGLFCSVRDDGRGFDMATQRDGVGLSRSVRARVEELGGSVAIKSAPADGTEVTLRIPPRPRA